MESQSERDRLFMNQAIEWSKRGDPSPNPHVGCVIVNLDEQGLESIVGSGFHTVAGAPHAEAMALNDAGERARGGTAYVTLEPCNHTGRTPPCAGSLINAGIKRVVIACNDPNPNVSGGGIAHLRAAGIEVVEHCQTEAAEQIVGPWLDFVRRGRSSISLKLAVSLDGRTAARTGASKWITGKLSRKRVHELRSGHDAVMIGVGTLLADDPDLTVRDAKGRNPIRVVVDSKLRTPVDSRLVISADAAPTCIITTEAAPQENLIALESAGVAVLVANSTPEGRVDLIHALELLAEREVVSVLCEGGSELAGSVLAAELVGDVHLFIAPILLGPRGRPAALAWAGPEAPGSAPRIISPHWERLGEDAYVWGKLGL